MSAAIRLQGKASRRLSSIGVAFFGVIVRYSVLIRRMSLSVIRDRSGSEESVFTSAAVLTLKTIV